MKLNQSRLTLVLISTLVLAALILATSNFQTARADNDNRPRRVHVMVITMFGNEAAPWIAKEGLTDEIKVPGLSPNFPTVKCQPPARDNGKGKDKDPNNEILLCNVVTDQGFSNAASTIMALTMSGKFDLRNTYFLIAGIAGVDPADGTLGSAAWARYVIDFGLAHEIDAREMPADWPYGYTGFGPVAPGVKPARFDGTEVYHLNDTLVQRAYDLTKKLDLTVNDVPTAQAYRALYPANTPASQPPSVIMCDSVAVDTYWHGVLLSKRANDWAKLLTDGAANYCMTNEEDNATLTALKRSSNAGLVNFNRVLVLRTASNFDQQHPGQTAWESLTTRSGGFLPSVNNAYLVGSTFVHNVNKNWPKWVKGVPAAEKDGDLTVNPK